MSGKSLNNSDISNLDRQIAELMECKPLPEAEVKFLCEKVKKTKYNFFKFQTLNKLKDKKTPIRSLKRTEN